MATFSIESTMLQKYELALNRLGESRATARKRPIVARSTAKASEQEAVSAAANALAALWSKRLPKPSLASINRKN